MTDAAVRWSVLAEYSVTEPLTPAKRRALVRAIGAAVRPALVSGTDRLLVWPVVSAPHDRRAARLAIRVTVDAARTAGLDTLGDPISVTTTALTPAPRDR